VALEFLSLELKPGDSVEVEQLQGERRRFELPIAGTVKEFIGISAYLELDAMNRMLGEGERCRVEGSAATQ